MIDWFNMAAAGEVIGHSRRIKKKKKHQNAMDITMLLSILLFS